MINDNSNFTEVDIEKQEESLYDDSNKDEGAIKAKNTDIEEEHETTTNKKFKQKGQLTVSKAAGPSIEQITVLKGGLENHFEQNPYRLYTVLNCVNNVRNFYENTDPNVKAIKAMLKGKKALANSVDPDETPHEAASHQGLRYFLK
ncbi:hypothetical protein DPMN_109510 [Dreissena polymorpha]|uniref:Uncharacterized protein n=1 Tax=Dreissena polymorpha TaxID=45954 RepID=A0A9D4KAV6_DREPO|nr:hypothetical protein DPMN_109510 [Dreissena polymorpha]